MSDDVKCIHGKAEHECEHCRERDLSELSPTQFRDAFQGAVRGSPVRKESKVLSFG